MLRPSDPLPGFVNPGVIVEAFAQGIRPHRKISVSECAALHRRVSNPPTYVGPWKNETTPYLVEPMDRAISREVEELYVVGPSQWGKTEIPKNVIGHAVKYRPADVLLIQPTKSLAADFSERRIENKFLDVSPDLRAELGQDLSDDKTFSKQFRNGTMLTIAWPVAGELSSRSCPIVILDERDRIPDNIGKEGDPVSLARNRKKIFGRAGILIGVSSPSRADYTGIMPLYDLGDRNLWFWPCVQCDEFFSPGFDQDRKPDPLGQLHLPKGVTVELAYDLARLLCPECGFPHEERHKVGMNARGTWIPEGCTIDRSGRISGERRSSRVASYWGSGLISPFVSWGEIAKNLLEAEAYFERTQEEDKLQVVYNTDFGIPYVSRLEGQRAVDSDQLRERAEAGYRLGQVPPGIRYLTGAVDIQRDCFDVGVKGWDEHGESWWIDRFAIRQLADGRTDVDPARYPEHWDVLIERVLQLSYPLLEQSGLSLAVAKTAIDTGGLDGVTENAYEFYRRALKTVPKRSLMLVKGHNIRNAPSLPLRPTYEGAGDKKSKRRAVPLYVIGVNRLKDALANRLQRDELGPGYIHYPEDFPARAFEELDGERKENGIWVRKGPNETFDLDVYCTAARLLLRPEKVNWSYPPVWALPVAAGGPAHPVPAAPASAAPQRPNDWLGGHVGGDWI